MRPPDAYQRARLEPTAKGDTTMGRTVPDTATDASAPELRAAGPTTWTPSSTCSPESSWTTRS